MPDPIVLFGDEPAAGDAAPPSPPLAVHPAPAASGLPLTAGPAAQPSRSSASACTLVIKSLPFSMTIPAITAAIGSRVAVPPSSIAPVRDHQGVFRGTAFVAFPTVADADSAAEALAGVQLVGSRRLVVERVREREPVSTAARGKELRRAALAKGVSPEAVDALEAFVMSFVRARGSERTGAPPVAGDDTPPTAGVVKRPLTSAERRYVHARAGSLGLEHVTVPWGDAEDDRSVRVAIKAVEAGPLSAAPGDGDDTAVDGDGAAAEVAAMAKANTASVAGAAASAAAAGAAAKAASPATSAAAPDAPPSTAPGLPTGGGGGAGPDGLLVHGGSRQWYAPPRQPTGPDGTLGFHAARKAAEAALGGLTLTDGTGQGDARGGSDAVGDGPEAGAAPAGCGDGGDA
ncbi:hypothetical protein I4F81_006931 [Pyropia yezoensis]|uniref:Uncharacterized protein n=1 Tax=Pyropia yezoensis TaxID=2788 RepID=A0ACC3C2Q2_PYRYE|nr:hypothetical protein I4F81_006931 [Neopyropia yezoensis]